MVDLLQDVHATLESGATIVDQCIAQDSHAFHVGERFAIHIDSLRQQSLAIALAHALGLAARHPDVCLQIACSRDFKHLFKHTAASLIAGRRKAATKSRRLATRLSFEHFHENELDHVAAHVSSSPATSKSSVVEHAECQLQGLELRDW